MDGQIGVVGAAASMRRAHDVGAHHHAGAAAGGRVVHGAMPADAEVADADGLERPQSLAQRLAGQRGRQRPREQLGKQGERPSRAMAQRVDGEVDDVAAR